MALGIFVHGYLGPRDWWHPPRSPSLQTNAANPALPSGGSKPPKHLAPKPQENWLKPTQEKHGVCGSSTLTKKTFSIFVDSTAGGELRGVPNLKGTCCFFPLRESPRILPATFSEPANVSQWHKHSKQLHASAPRYHRGQATALTAPCCRRITCKWWAQSHQL